MSFKKPPCLAIYSPAGVTGGLTRVSQRDPGRIHWSPRITPTLVCSLPRSAPRTTRWHGKASTTTASAPPHAPVNRTSSTAWAPRGSEHLVGPWACAPRRPLPLTRLTRHVKGGGAGLAAEHPQGLQRDEGVHGVPASPNSTMTRKRQRPKNKMSRPRRHCRRKCFPQGSSLQAHRGA